ncbi:uncharacterized protein LOC131674328 [Phymastichus coffea]|uniref:uncharacterized protein LOC131674328 n=1 Tax=Phymastichus coffea TaxID=108790 RepID=UPI00273BD600|nr:uncharacterized protein LOC131674328 [Phymastichus coffea]
MFSQLEIYLNNYNIGEDGENILILYENYEIFTTILRFLTINLAKYSIRPNINIYCLFIECDSIDENAVFYRITNNFFKKGGKLNFKGYTVSLSDFFVNERILIKSIKTCKVDKDLKKCYSYSNKLLSSTLNQDLILKMQYKVVCSAARSLNCATVIFNKCTITSTSDIISSMILGHKSIISFQGFHCKKNMNIQVLYPMDIFNLSIPTNVYSHENYRNYDKNVNKFEGHIQKLTKDFILKLNSVDNIIKTLNELSKKLDLDYSFSANKYCKLCYQSIDICVPSSIVNAKQFSVSISRIGNLIRIVQINNLKEKIFNNNLRFPLTYFNISAEPCTPSLNFKKLYCAMNFCYSCITYIVRCKKVSWEIDVSNHFIEK